MQDEIIGSGDSRYQTRAGQNNAGAEQLVATWLRVQHWPHRESKLGIIL